MINIPKWKVFLILGICVLGLVFASPNLFNKETVADYFPSWLSQVNLGLDLQGGSHLLLEVDVQSGLKDALSSVVEDLRVSLRKEKIGYVDLKVKDGAVTFKLRDPSQAELAKTTIARSNAEVDLKQVGDRQFSLTFKEDAARERKRSMIQQSIEIVRRRIDEYGTTEPNIQQQGEDQIVVELPGETDPSRVRKLLGKTAKMTFRLVHPESPQLVASGKVPPGSELLLSVDGESERAYVVQKQILLTGENLVDAQPGFDQFSRPAVNFKFDTFGGRKFGDITRKNTNRVLAIVLDGKVISAPRIDEPITGAQGIITGQFSVKQTADLSILMRAGALPAPLTVIEERTVGAELGADSVTAGKHATILSVILVAVLMLLVYSVFGLFANIALIFNIVLLVAAVSLIHATLTLPGIAGIALTLGMAVDANVLIFERIKEELRNGRKTMAALDAGYTMAMGTIIDSNLTTLIGGALLYVFGTGPIRGFAITLSLGIIISMFTAISLTRVMAVYWLRWRRPQRLPI